MNRRAFLAASALAALASAAFADTPRMHVAKTATCGCCAAWIDHMEEAGFAVSAEDTDQGSLVMLKRRLGITAETASCHTAQIDGYVIEGHVPAEDVRRLLAERPEAVGLAAPGMPVGSPGMEYGDEREPYDVVLIRRDGGTEVFSSR